MKPCLNDKGVSVARAARGFASRSAVFLHRTKKLSAGTKQPAHGFQGAPLSGGKGALAVVPVLPDCTMDVLQV